MMFLIRFEYLFTATDFNSYVTVSSAEGAPKRDNGRMSASIEPGLGISPKMDALGDPVLDISWSFENPLLSVSRFLVNYELYINNNRRWGMNDIINIATKILKEKTWTRQFPY